MHHISVNTLGIIYLFENNHLRRVSSSVLSNQLLRRFRNRWVGKISEWSDHFVLLGDGAISRRLAYEVIWNLCLVTYELVTIIFPAMQKVSEELI